MQPPSNASKWFVKRIPCWRVGDKLYRINQPDGDGLLGWTIREDGLLDTVVRQRGEVLTLVPPDPSRALDITDLQEIKSF